jgi:cysteine-rich repeat protein
MRLVSISTGFLAALTLVACTVQNAGNEADETAGTGSEGIGDGDGEPTTGDGDGEPTTGDGDGEPTTGDGDGEPTTGDGDGEGAVCGNGIVEAFEGCDDGNTEDGDGCSSDCGFEGPIPCGNAFYQCGDEADNDMDGFVDMDDPECITPCDDNEGSFKTDLPGQNNDCKSDCYFDSNSGGGEDGCEWNLKCDPENSGAEIGCEYDPNLMCELEMPPECLEFCVPLVPNGCDCFGCCEINGQFVYLDGANCTLDDLDSCNSCTFYENCNNPCMPELCELCFGQDPEDLPEECGGEPDCPPELDPCLTDADCAEGLFCLTGCCIPVDIG